MARLKPQISDSFLKSLKPKPQKYFIGDGENLLIEIRPNGRKSFVLEYKSPATLKKTRLTLGEYPTLSLKSAMKKMRVGLALFRLWL